MMEIERKMEITPDEVKLFKAILGDRYKAEPFEAAFEVVENPEAQVEEELTPETLSKAIPKISPDDEETETPKLETIRSDMNDVLEPIFLNAEPLSETTAYKWQEMLEMIFDSFPLSKEILTTENYVNANLTGRKVHWNLYYLNGHYWIQIGCKRFWTKAS
ncbi:hypothetical protein JCM33374_g446 [Metschnikowia sp. JCM 33374]|nr:hypothetical protein JCM33374_g446 [Metschnikowia sp. JCM 33374]